MLANKTLKQNQNIRIKINRILSGLIVTALFLLVVKVFLFQQMRVIGASMDPNYHSGELIIVNKLKEGLQRGQVVSIFSDQNNITPAEFLIPANNKIFLKRVVALPGEEIELFEDKVVIYNKDFPQGKILEENYISGSVKEELILKHYYFPRTKIPQNSYFCLGDNRPNSLDSSAFGPIKQDAVYGREALKLWPLNKAAVFNLPKYNYLEITTETQNKLNYYQNKHYTETQNQT